MRDMATLRDVADRANAALAHVWTLYEMGEAPLLTAGMVDAVLEAAGQTGAPPQMIAEQTARGTRKAVPEPPRAAQPRGQAAMASGPLKAMASCPPTAKAAVPSTAPAAAESSQNGTDAADSSQNGNLDEVERAVIAQLRRLAVDDVTPTQVTWNAACGSLPISGDLYHMFRRRQWSSWAELAGLTLVKRGAKRKETPAAQEGTFRRSSPVSASAAAVLGPEHVVVSPHGSERAEHGRNGEAPSA